MAKAKPKAVSGLRATPLSQGAIRRRKRNLRRVAFSIRLPVDLAKFVLRHGITPTIETAVRKHYEEVQCATTASTRNR